MTDDDLAPQTPDPAEEPTAAGVDSASPSESHRAPRAHRDRGPRTTLAARTWTAIALAAVLLIAVVIFVAQNDRRVDISFVSLHGHISLALGLLVAFVAGIALAVLVGSTRIVQLRLQSRRDRRAITQLTNKS